MFPDPLQPLPRPEVLAGQELPAAPQQERSRRKREALLDAALLLFGEQGYDATSIEAIASRAGVAVGAFYQHFASKRQLLLVLMDQLIGEAESLTAQAPSQPHADVHTLLADLVRQAIGLDWAFAGAYRAWHEAAARDHELYVLHQQIEGWTTQRTAALLDQLYRSLPGRREGLDLASLAWLLNQLFWRIAEQPLTDEVAAERVVRTLSDIIYHALFDDGAATQR